MQSIEMMRPRMILKDMPLPASKSVKNWSTERIYKDFVLEPGTKVPLAPYGAPEWKQVIIAAEVASQISRATLLSKSRVREVTRWRAACFFVMREIFCRMSIKQAANCLRKDHTTMMHHIRLRKYDPRYYRQEINAIKEVLK
jgi:Bacterial dnaA protein helix-turn-helix